MLVQKTNLTIFSEYHNIRTGKDPCQHFARGHEIPGLVELVCYVGVVVTDVAFIHIFGAMANRLLFWQINVEARSKLIDFFPGKGDIECAFSFDLYSHRAC